MAGSVLERLRERVGDAGMVADAGLAWMERQHKQAIDMDIPVVSKVTEAVLQPAVLGARVALANLTSGGGKYYQPEVRDERYFSNNALHELGQSVRHMRGTSGRADGMDNAAQFNLTQTIGGFSVRDGKVTDSFDINRSYATVPQPLTDVARAVLGREEDPDRGKVRTEIPLDRLAAKAGASRNRAEMSNFLATDKVPDTIFGIPVVSRKEDYTERDIEFFKEHPEAGGYYDMEDGNEDTSSAEEVPAQGMGEVQPGEPAGEGVPQMAEKAGKTYDTVIPKEREAEYQAWRATLPKPLQYEGDYDLRGYWMDPDTKKTAVTGDHFIDKYKKPNHPTFSVESKYAVGPDANLAGTWDGETYVPNPARTHELAIREAIPFIKEHEGFRGKAYQDSVGKWTIGYGQTEIGGRKVRPGDTITEEDAAKFVEQRVRDNAAELYKNSSWTNAASPKALAALYDVAYNTGVDALYEKKSPSLNRNGTAAIGTNAVDAAIWREIPTYIKAGGRVLKGLKNRREDAIRTWKEK